MSSKVKWLVAEIAQTTEKHKLISIAGLVSTAQRLSIVRIVSIAELNNCPQLFEQSRVEQLSPIV